MDIHGYPWISTHGPWISLDYPRIINGLSMGIHGYFNFQCCFRVFLTAPCILMSGAFLGACIGIYGALYVYVRCLVGCLYCLFVSYMYMFRVFVFGALYVYLRCLFGCVYFYLLRFALFISGVFVGACISISGAAWPRKCTRHMHTWHRNANSSDGKYTHTSPRNDPRNQNTRHRNEPGNKSTMPRNGTTN